MGRVYDRRGRDEEEWMEPRRSILTVKSPIVMSVHVFEILDGIYEDDEQWGWD